MVTIYHETQLKEMCALHAINSLLQGPVFTAYDLALIGEELDQEESALFGGSDNGDNSDEPSANVDYNAGNFSIQVIMRALARKNIELVPIYSSDPRAERARQRTVDQKAFIINKHLSDNQNHWIALRNFKDYGWYNLDSLLRQAEPLSDDGNHLSLLLEQQDIMDIFLVVGEFPERKCYNSWLNWYCSIRNQYRSTLKSITHWFTAG